MQEDVTWEDRINHIITVLDLWKDVQRQWMDLEGIFMGSANIEHILPVDTSLFQR